jgi:hypothetical protein
MAQAGNAVSGGRQHRHRRDAAHGISCQAKCVNSGVRATALDRKTETGEGRLSSVETIGVFIAIPVTDPGGGRIMARDVTGRFEGELIGLLGNFAVGFEKRQNVRNSAVDVVDMMNAVQPARCLLELRADELEKTRNVCGQHGTTRLAVAIQPAQVSRPPGDVCIKLNTSERIPTISAVVSGESNWRGRSSGPLVCIDEPSLEAYGQ